MIVNAYLGEKCNIWWESPSAGWRIFSFQKSCKMVFDLSVLPYFEII